MSMFFKPTNDMYLSDLTQEDINRDIKNVLNLLRDIKIPLISFFGSARIKQDNLYAQKAQQLAYELGKNGYGILTGGGSGIMQAANTGAYKAGTVSVGLSAEVLKHEHIQDDIFTHKLDIKYMLIRRFAMSMRSHAYIFFPGGFGTINEIFEYIMLIQVGLYEKIPFILIGKEFYDPMLKWIDDCMLKEKTISKEDIKLFTQEDSLDVIVDTIKNFVNVYKIK